MTWVVGGIGNSIGAGPLFPPEPLATLESIVQSVPLQLVVQVGQLLQEALVRPDVAVHSHRSDRLGGGHLAGDHQVGQDAGRRTRHAHHAVDQHFASTVDSVLDELGRDVEIPADVGRWLIDQREAHVPHTGHVPIVAVTGVHLSKSRSFRRIQHVCDSNQS